MSIWKKILVAVMGAALATLGAVGASAGTWQDNHPRRVEVNHRLANQDMRIDRNLRAGRITRQEAVYLHRKDLTIRMRERHDAALHGGHITRLEQARLNHAENRVGGQIYRVAH